MKPLRGAKGRVHAALEDQPPEARFKPPEAQSKTKADTPVAANKRTETAPRLAPDLTAKAVTAAARKSPPLADFDTKRARKLRTGKVEIDARIDLHGMRQSEAHSALRSFLHSSHRKGHSLVLVITGKGAPAGVKPEGSWIDMMGRSERGVLRRNVPQWLGHPDLRAVVVSFTEAAIRHGGEGALYVHLRRKPL